MNARDGKQSVLQFERGAIKHGVATLAGDSKMANHSANDIKAAVEALRREERLGELVPLCESEHDSVRVWAARFLLGHDSDRAIKALEAVALKDGIIGFSALMTLNEWKAGRLKV